MLALTPRRRFTPIMRYGGLLFIVAWAFTCAGCGSRAEAERAHPREPGLQPKLGRSPAAAAVKSATPSGRTVVFTGACDASGAVALDAGKFALADDEDNVLRVYDANTGGAPLSATDVSPLLHLSKKKKKKTKRAESDLEAGTRVGDHALWLSSHARSKKGKVKPDRFRYFSTNVPSDGGAITVRGDVYDALLRDLLAEPALDPLGLSAAAELPPQADGGLNIEGMTAMPDGGVLLGFRNPVPRGRALLVPMTNPLAPLSGERLRFGKAIEVDLGGLGVRALSHWRGKYLIAAGHYGDGGAHRLYTWSGAGTRPEPVPGALPDDFNPEAFFTPEERDELLVLSDDGTRSIDGTVCKELDDPAQKRFRGLWLRLPN